MIALTNETINDSIKNFSISITTLDNPIIGLVEYKPESWAKYSFCLDNVARKVREHGGTPRCGWVFYLNAPQDIPNQYYLIAQHHAVWHAPSLELIDITPYHDNKNLRPWWWSENNLLFLFDDEAKPIPAKNVTLATLPIKYFPIGNDESLIEYIKTLEAQEAADHQNHFWG